MFLSASHGCLLHPLFITCQSVPPHRLSSKVLPHHPPYCSHFSSAPHHVAVCPRPTGPPFRRLGFFTPCPRCVQIPSSSTIHFVLASQPILCLHSNKCLFPSAAFHLSTVSSWRLTFQSGVRLLDTLVTFSPTDSLDKIHGHGAHHKWCHVTSLRLSMDVLVYQQPRTCRATGSVVSNFTRVTKVIIKIASGTRGLTGMRLPSVGALWGQQTRK